MFTYAKMFDLLKKTHMKIYNINALVTHYFEIDPNFSSKVAQV